MEQEWQDDRTNLLSDNTTRYLIHAATGKPPRDDQFQEPDADADLPHDEPSTAAPFAGGESTDLTAAPPDTADQCNTRWTRRLLETPPASTSGTPQ
eukprot:4920016-Heterocapsa_arctica.AAC.1